MKHLYLLRHAQAMPIETGRSDIDRHLTPQGQADATALGCEMIKRNMMPELILCSAAKRTQETLEKIKSILPQSTSTKILPSLYDATRGTLLSILQSTENSINSLLLIGHNPAIYELCVMLSGQAPESLSRRLMQGYPPATLTAFNIPIENWAEIDPEKTELTTLLSPIDYNAPERPTRWM